MPVSNTRRFCDVLSGSTNKETDNFPFPAQQPKQICLINQISDPVDSLKS